MEPNTSTETTTPAKPARVPTKRPAKTASAKPAKVAAKVAKAKTAPKTEAPASGTGTPLKTLAAKLGIEPKLARRKLRAAKFDWHGHRERWTFNAKQLEKAREILSA